MVDRRDPFESMDRLFDQMRRSMFGMEPFGMERPRMARPGSGEQPWRDVNRRLEETDDGYLVLADLPGFEKADVDLRLRDGVLSISVHHEAADDEHARIQRSRHVHDEVNVPGDVREDEISASYRNGVLEVVLPVPEGVEPTGRRIDIE